MTTKDPQMQTHLPASTQPKIPKVIIIALVAVNLLLGLAQLKHGHAWANWLDVFWQWALLLLIIPAGICLVALPLKLRDNTFVLKHAFYMGLFVAFLYAINALRYLR